MTNYSKIQLISYGAVTSTPTRVLTGDQSNRYYEDLASRGRTLCDVADWVATTSASALADPDTLKVFVAPEFYFRYGGPSDPPEVLNDSYPDGEQLLPRLSEEILKPHFAAQGYSDWVIVAGSMFWHKRGPAHPSYFNTTLVINGGPDTALTPQERAANADVRALATVGAATTNQKSLMSNIDYAIGVDRSEWDASLNPMFRLSFTDDEFWRWHVFAAHGKAGPQGQPLVFGLEVCLEHIVAYAGSDSDVGLLRTMEARVPDQPEVDVHLVTSCGMTLNPAFGVAARDDGYAMIVDGMQPGVPPLPWPNADVRRVTRVQQDGRRSVGASARVLSNRPLPANLQLGIANNQHNPPDAVAVWEPVPLAERA
ncbi:hypothetical protein [Actinokineospora diospyrosa]|uniref:Uncharacterized protein n=1 Tax=Actinokineospora diospyrosa TaxID=103728 RepID=A0ABT1IKZ8_9PSEU|nr:hypothetical protein [Actinokineospora diospyrosa]MCP2273330.1 hypothetical protein [Actinokineospora diospyrosa]